MTHSALILIDIQNDYFPSFPAAKYPLPHMEAAAENAALLLTKARKDGVKIIHIRHISPSTNAPFFHPGTAGSEIHQSVSSQKGEIVVHKARPNSFQGTELGAILEQAGIKELTICGAMSQMCVDATARAAVDFGYKVTLVHDACAAANATFGEVSVPAAQVHAAIMAPLAASYAQVIATRDYL
ncbi:cysteine hydrolase family protein [Planktotalea sp.]|uniref:cysteine hydrolase family protein n=1 Tax=Planktotalea sp. TaxID=2029877 RepID=UPI00329712E1